MRVVSNNIEFFGLFIQNSSEMNVILQHIFSLVLILEISLLVLVSEHVFGLIAFFGVGVALVEYLKGLW